MDSEGIQQFEFLDCYFIFLKRDCY